MYQSDICFLLFNSAEIIFIILFKILQNYLVNYYLVFIFRKYNVCYWTRSSIQKFVSSFGLVVFRFSSQISFMRPTVKIVFPFLIIVLIKIFITYISTKQGYRDITRKMLTLHETFETNINNLMKCGENFRR